MQEQQIIARRLISTLDAAELQLLVATVRGMSAKDAAAATGLVLEVAKRARSSMMKKLGAGRAADAVRIGLIARVDLAN